jgi:hypothetical protein
MGVVVLADVVSGCVVVVFGCACSVYISRIIVITVSLLIEILIEGSLETLVELSSEILHSMNL